MTSDAQTIPPGESLPADACPWCGEAEYCERCGDCRRCPTGCICEDEPEAPDWPAISSAGLTPETRYHVRVIDPAAQMRYQVPTFRERVSAWLCAVRWWLSMVPRF